MKPSVRHSRLPRLPRLALLATAVLVPALARAAEPAPLDPPVATPAPAAPVAPAPSAAPAFAPDPTALSQPLTQPLPQPLPLPDRPSAAPAVEDEEIHGVEAGLRTGLALPMGTVAGNIALSDMTSNHVPLWVDLGYRFSDRFLVAGYGQYGFLSVKCNPGIDCSGFDARVGVQLQVHLQPHGEADPWLGAGFGYEAMHMSAQAAGASETLDLSGLELLNLQAGLDWNSSPHVGFGPFASMAISQFSSGSDNGRDLTIGNKGLHEWLTLGFRAVVR